MENDLLMACLRELNHGGNAADDGIPDDDIATLIEVLHSSDSASDDTSPNMTKKRPRKRAAHELVYLRDKVVDYTRQLHELQKRLTPHTEEALVWHERSLRQLSARKAAEDENQALKEMLQRQVQMAESLMKIISKRPRVAEMTYLNKWRQSHTFGLDPAERREMFHALLDGHHSRLENVFIAKRLYDPTEKEHTIKTDVSYDEASGDVVFDFVSTVTEDVDYLLCANAIWEVYGATFETLLESSQPLEWFDENALIVKSLLKVKKYDLVVHHHMGCKRYLEQDRVVMVFDSILDDQLHPYPPGVYVARETSWWTITKTGDNECAMAYYMHGKLPTKSTEEPNDAHFHKMAFAEHILDCYKRSIDMLAEHLDGELAAFQESQSLDCTS